MSSRNRHKNPYLHRCYKNVLPTEKSLVQFHLGYFFKFLGNQGELERTQTTKIFVDAGLSF